MTLWVVLITMIAMNHYDSENCGRGCGGGDFDSADMFGIAGGGAGSDFNDDDFFMKRSD